MTLLEDLHWADAESLARKVAFALCRDTTGRFHGPILGSAFPSLRWGPAHKPDSNAFLGWKQPLAGRPRPGADPRIPDAQGDLMTR